MARVDVSKIEKSYGQVKVIHSLDLTIEDGSFVVLLGLRAAANPPCCA